MIKAELEKEKLCMIGKKERIPIIDPVIAARESAELAEIKRKAEMVEIDQEVSVVIIKPELSSEDMLQEIKQNFAKDGFTILLEKNILIEREVARNHYSFLENEDDTNYTENLCSNQSTILVIVKNAENSIQDVLSKVGPFNYEHAKNSFPESLVAKYGLSNVQNGLEAAQNKEQANK
ncbi:Thioredoxin domain-containing protein 3 [Cichlidogyrus casuarinus]|uniref:Thioredoxin domain-containing protein 3 n=1 Tax=Cichlidogyrus casuarinus TaxID=1844966 RepID=A0ABD2QJ92_9PLAT